MSAQRRTGPRAANAVPELDKHARNNCFKQIEISIGKQDKALVNKDATVRNQSNGSGGELGSR